MNWAVPQLEQIRLTLETEYKPGTVRQWADGPHQKQADGSWAEVPDKPGSASAEKPAEPAAAAPKKVEKYEDDPNAFNSTLAKMMNKLKKDVGAENVRQNYKGTGKQAHRRQIFVRLPEHERGGPDVWLDSGYVKVGGVIGVPKEIPSVKKYEGSSPEEVYGWIRDTLKAINAHEKAKWAAKAKGESALVREMRRITNVLDSRWEGKDIE